MPNTIQKLPNSIQKLPNGIKITQLHTKIAQKHTKIAQLHTKIAQKHTKICPIAYVTVNVTKVSNAFKMTYSCCFSSMALYDFYISSEEMVL